jgi:hypothetical protein
MTKLQRELDLEREWELDLERGWELYRLSVVETMPDSAYKTAALAEIADKLKMLNRIEAACGPSWSGRYPLPGERP